MPESVSHIISCLAGGMLRDGLIPNQTAANLRAVFAPKVAGLSNLANSSWVTAVQQIAAFSSVAVLVGSAGQATYAAANGTMTPKSPSCRTLASLVPSSLFTLTETFYWNQDWP